MIYILFTRWIYIDFSINLVFIEINRWLQSTTGLRVHIWRQVPRGHYKSSMVQGKHRNDGLQEATQISMSFFPRKSIINTLKCQIVSNLFSIITTPQNNHIPTWEKERSLTQKVLDGWGDDSYQEGIHCIHFFVCGFSNHLHLHEK